MCLRKFRANRSDGISVLYCTHGPLGSYCTPVLLTVAPCVMCIIQDRCHDTACAVQGIKGIASCSPLTVRDFVKGSIHVPAKGKEL